MKKKYQRQGTVSFSKDTDSYKGYKRCELLPHQTDRKRNTI